MRGSEWGPHFEYVGTNKWLLMDRVKCFMIFLCLARVCLHEKKKFGILVDSVLDLPISLLVDDCREFVFWS